MVIENFHLFSKSDHTALICNDQKLSYKTLWARTEALARYLQENFPSDYPIAIYGDKENDMVTGMLGALKAGKPYVILSANFPKNRLSAILSDCDADCLLCPENRHFPCGLPVITSDDIDGLVNTYSDLPPIDLTQRPTDRIVSIVYTSGSTGTPKGVEITYKNLSILGDRMVSEMRTIFQSDLTQYRELSFTSYGVVNSLRIVLVIGGLGGTWIACSKKLLNTDEMLTLLKRYRVTVLGNTPSMILQLLNFNHFNSMNLPDLKRIILAGEPFPTMTAKKLKERFPDAFIYNKYGSTEVTASGFSCLLTEKMLETDELYCPVDDGTDTVAFLSDEQGQRITTENQIGEFVFYGDMVAGGYHNDPENTKAKFFSLSDGTPAFKIGDLGVIRGGYTYVVGRKDHQVKIGGNRVELNETETRMAQCDIVKECAVVCQKDHKQNDYLVGFVVLTDESAVLSQLQAFLQIKNEMMRQMESYKIPQKIIFVDALPKTAGGKIDRMTLRNL